MIKRIFTVTALAASSTILAMGTASAAPAPAAGAPAPAAASYHTTAGFFDPCDIIQHIPVIGFTMCS